MLSPYALIAFLSISVGGGTYATSSRQPVPSPTYRLSPCLVHGLFTSAVRLIPHIMSLPVPISVLRSPSSVLRPPSSESFRPSLIMLRGGLPRAVCCCRRHSVGWYGLNADRFSSGQSPEFTGLLSGNSSAATLTGLATEGPANIA